ncbi:hypothetical protein N9I71_03790 [Amylibacter sp.]|nr:hypothetical protein [Amylibacter sp.]
MCVFAYKSVCFEDVFHDYGKISSASGFKYAGEWKNGYQSGSAKIFYKNGDCYQGLVKNGVRNGFGRFQEKLSQRTFKGNWNNGVLIGEVEILSDEWDFIGSLNNQNGRTRGKLTYSDGSVYVGDLLNFTRHGIGKFTNKSGNKILGYWVDDTSVNFSTSTDAHGFKWYGSLRNLKPHGFMKVRLPNGQKYNGVWHNGDLQEAFSIQKNSHNDPVNHIQ